MIRRPLFLSFFFFNDTATTEIYTLSLHDALPILVSLGSACPRSRQLSIARRRVTPISRKLRDRKSTRLNSSHDQISYAVFCLKKKKKHRTSPYACMAMKTRRLADSPSASYLRPDL